MHRQAGECGGRLEGVVNWQVVVEGKKGSSTKAGVEGGWGQL